MTILDRIAQRLAYPKQRQVLMQLEHYPLRTDILLLSRGEIEELLKAVK